MRLKHIIIRNFSSFREADLEFPSGLCAVAGRNIDNGGANGSGKTSLFDAIVWALYGRTLIACSPDDVIRHGADEAAVELYFNRGGVDYKILRSRGSKSLLAFWIVGESRQDLTQGTIPLTQAKIEQVIGLDYRAFAAVATFGADALKFAGATDKEQKEILERLMGLEVYGDALTKVRAETAALKSEVVSATMVLENHRRIINRSADQIAALETKKAEVAQGFANQLVALQQEYLQAQAKVETLKSQEQSLEAQLTEIDASLAGVPERDALVDQASREVYAADAARRGATGARDVLKGQYLEAVRRLESANSRIGTPCSECGRVITEKELAATVDSLTQKRDSLQTQINDKHNAVLGAQADWEAKSKLHGDLDKAFRERDAARQEVLKFRRDLDTQLRGVRTQLFTANGAPATIQARINGLDDGRQLAAMIDSQKATLLSDRNREAEMVAGISNQQERLKYLEFWEQAFGYSGIRSVLLDGVAKFLTETANRFLSRLSNGSVRIEVSTQSTLKSGERREKFDVKVFNRNGADVYARNSGGERQRIDIALALALHALARQRSGIPVEFAIFDEVFERVDESGCEAVIATLRHEQDGLGTIFVVSHNPSLVERFPGVIEVEKREGVSRIVRTPCEKSAPASTSVLPASSPPPPSALAEPTPPRSVDVPAAPSTSTATSSSLSKKGRRGPKATASS